MTTKNDAALTNLRAAIWTHVNATDSVVEALKAAGETDEVKSLVLRTYMARRMNPAAATCTDAMLKKAAQVLDLLGANSKTEGKKRTVEQERFYTGARQYLWAIRKKAGVEASDNRGGANNSGPRQPVAKDGDIPIAPPAKDEAKTELDVRRKVLGMQAAIMAYVESQRAKGICGDATVRPIANCMKQIAGWAAKPE
jgi:hypothetical protein